MTVAALLIVGLALVLFVGGPLNRIALAIEKQNDHYDIGQPDEAPPDDGAGPEASA